MNSKRWNDEEIKLLRQLTEKGKSAQEIAIILNRSKKSIENKLFKLNISSSKHKYKYKVNEVVNETLKIVDQIRVKNGSGSHRGYVVQSIIYPNTEAYEVSEYNLDKGVGCAYVAGRKVCDENSLWSVESLRDNIIDVEEAKNIVAHSNKKVRFKCSTIGCNNTKIMDTFNLVRRGYSCALCDSNISYPERMMASYFKVKNIKYETQVMFDDSQRKIDFYVPSLDIYIETHGEQHYNENSSWYEPSLISDKIKRKWAKDNNKTLIELDCRKSEFEFIEKSISENKYLPNISEFEKKEVIDEIKLSSKYDVQNIIKMYQKGLSAYEISDKFNLSPAIIYNILKHNDVNRRVKNTK